MGLLDGFSDFIKTPEGQGLLSAGFAGLAGAQRGAPINSIGRAGLAGLTGYGNALDRQTQLAESEQMKKYRDMQQQTMQMQLENAKREAEKSKKLDALIPQFSKPGQSAQPAAPAIPGLTPIDGMLPPELQIGTPARAAVPAVAPSFDMEGFAQAAMGVDPMKGLGYMQAAAKDNTPISVAPGASLIDKRTFKPVFTAPPKADSDPKIQQYEYAKNNGYKGTFEQFVTLGPTIMAAAQAPLRQAQVDNIQQENDYNLPPPRPAKTTPAAAPMRGQVVQGYKFKGGNPADKNNWEKQ